MDCPDQWLVFFLAGPETFWAQWTQGVVLVWAYAFWAFYPRWL